MNRRLAKIVAGFISIIFGLSLLLGPVQVVVLALDESIPPTTPTATEPTPTPTLIPTSNPDPTPTPTPTLTTTSNQTIQGPTQPTGPDANTYTYNTNTGKWENEHYIWDPVTKQTSPKNPVNYSYNPSTGMWDTAEWIYNTASDKYEQNIISVAGSASLPVALSLAPSELSVSKINNNSTTNQTFDLFFNATISNNITANAITGNASVLNNTHGGNAITGSATDAANIINTINSYYGFLTVNPMVYTADIAGDVTGDLTIDPAQITASTSTSKSNVVVNATNNSAINNDINLTAKSGDAKVSSNTTAGNATTGDASAIVNLINLINSSIGSGQSFVGIINIYGNLNGDILLPQGILDSLLASNNSDPVFGSSTKQTLDANLVSNQTINNNLNLSAISGEATVTNNTTAGRATTGSATTNVTLFNLTGCQVVAKDALIVFVNVLGTWVGLIMDAPTGTTSGLISGGTTQNSSGNDKESINSNSNNLINNNLNLSSTTGNALVANNTNASNATSGDAYSSANILNINNSSFSLSDWFGILFINVFGNWYGSFGMNTAAGNPIKTQKFNKPVGLQVFAFTSKSIPRTSASSSSSNDNYDTNIPIFALANIDSNKPISPSDDNIFSYIQGISNNNIPTSQPKSYTGDLAKILGGLTIFAFFLSLLASIEPLKNVKLTKY